MINQQIIDSFKELLHRFGLLVEDYNQYLYKNPKPQVDIHKEITQISDALAQIENQIYT